MDEAHAAWVSPDQVVRKRHAAERPGGRHGHSHPGKAFRKRSRSVRRNHGGGQEDVCELQKLGSVSGSEHLCTQSLSRNTTLVLRGIKLRGRLGPNTALVTFYKTHQNGGN